MNRTRPLLHNPLTHAQLLAAWPERVPSRSALTCSETVNLSRMSEAKKRPIRPQRFFPPHFGPISTIESRPLRPHFCVSKYFPI
jgi:hypothetical protein